MPDASQAPARRQPDATFRNQASGARQTPARCPLDASQTQHFEIRRQAENFEMLRLTPDFETLRLTQDFKTLRLTPARPQPGARFRNQASDARFQNHASDVIFCDHASDVQYQSSYVVLWIIFGNSCLIPHVIR